MKPSEPVNTASLVVLISGRGSNMLALARACQDGTLPARVALVVSNRPDAAGLQAAQELGIPVAVVDHTQFESRELFDEALCERVSSVSPDWVILAGFMRILTPTFINRWPGRILNIHPSLLPLYPGLDTHKRALLAGDTEAGASVHIVTAELDAGPVIAQVKVPVYPDDTEATLAERVLNEEHQLYIQAVQLCVSSPCLPCDDTVLT